MGIQTTLATPESSSETLEFSLSGPSGRFDFKGFEVPEHLDGMGGEVILALHQFVGGRRVIQPFGDVPFDRISWSGILLGENTFVRSYGIDALRKAQQQLQLTYGPWKFNGVVKKYKPKPGHEGYLPYDLEFVPNADVSTSPELQAESLTQPSETSVSQASVLANGLATAYTSAGTNLQVLAICQNLIAFLSNLQNAQTSAGGFLANLTGVQISALAAQGASVALSLYNFSQNNTPASAGIADIANASSDAVSTAQMYWYIQQIVNLLLSLSAPSAQFIGTFSNPNLFALASQYYSDPDKWVVIAAANGLSSPFNVGVYTLVIPQ